MDKDYKEILLGTLGYEGGYDDTMAQSGVVSNRGLTQGLYDAWNKKKGNPSKNVKEAPWGDLYDIGFEEFYEPMKIDRLDSKPAKAVIFDFAFNSGIGNAAKVLQDVVGAKPDGIVGSKTLKKIRKYMEDNGEQKFISDFLDTRENYLKDLAIRKPEKHTQHLQGWMNRINDLRSKYLQ